ncbi:MAG: DUF4390 domain-containing protein [Thermodesulfobacteriota bacterium]|nr:DUF4390 domain-containing protein [Thermodesulfobacteriota bacterium]
MACSLCEERALAVKGRGAQKEHRGGRYRIITYIKRGLWVVSLCACLFSWERAWSGDARITDVEVQTTAEGVIVHFRVEGCFTEDLEKAILNGIPTTFQFLTALDRRRSWWKDKELASLEITHTVKYNNLKNEFVITRSEDEGCPLVVDSLSEAEEIMAEVQNLKIAELDILEKDHRYQVEIKAELSKITLPFYLHYVFRFFLFLWDFETDWYTLDFMY